ncbi:type II secretion system F family protein [Verrucomicrobiota bacterium]
MPRYKYIAMDSQGGESEGVLDAENQTQAVSMIRTKGFFPTRVSEIGGGAQTKEVAAAKVAGKGLRMEIRLPSFLGSRVKAKQLAIFTRQLATLIDAGMPLLRGLRILLKQEKHPALQKALNGMGEAVESGGTFSDALSLFPRIFDNLFINMVRAGEAGGVLEIVLTRLAEFMEKSERIKNKVKGAMIYPIVVLVVAIGIVTFLMIGVIPKFEQIFSELLGGGELPALTQFVIGISRMITQKGLYVLAVIVILVIAYKFGSKTKTGSYILDAAKLKMPLFGTLFLKTAIARFGRTLGTLMSSGVPVLQALNIVRDTSGNSVVARAIQKVHDNVKEGESMATPLESTKVFPGMVVSMVDVGEETGALPEMMMKIADSYEDEVDSTVEGLTSIIEPILIVMLALIIGTIVIAMFMPMIEIIGKMS